MPTVNKSIMMMMMMSAKNGINLRKNNFSLPEGGLGCSDGSYSLLAPLLIEESVYIN